MRLRLDLAYDGTEFHGWAVQPALRTVQGVLETALATVLRMDRVAVTCAGRTDTGVHARGQVVHLDLVEPVDVDLLVRRLNGLLPRDVRVLRGTEATPGFDARFAALWRRYVYRVADLPGTVDPLTRSHVLAWSRPLDLEAMNTAAGALLGEQDFAAFCRKRAGATTIRALLELRWERTPAGVAEATVRADAFCHNMVRALMGSLVKVGEGRRTPEWPAQVLSDAVRHPDVRVMPAHGLTLEEVAYPADAQLAARARSTRVVRTRG